MSFALEDMGENENEDEGAPHPQEEGAHDLLPGQQILVYGLEEEY